MNPVKYGGKSAPEVAFLSIFSLDFKQTPQISIFLNSHITSCSIMPLTWIKIT